MSARTWTSDKQIMAVPTGPNAVSCTIRDVARMAGVSIATVSRVTNGTATVSDETKAKIVNAISSLRYCANPHAVELRRANSRIPRN